MKLVTVVLAVGMLLMGNVAPAAASSNNISANAANTVGWATYPYSYNQNSGDDIAFDLTSGISIDMRWVNCAGTKFGAIKSGITLGEGYRVIGSNFIGGTCLHLQYRGATQTGAFSGSVYWQDDFVA